MSRKSDTQLIPFTQFGPLFVDQVLDTGRLKSQVAALVGGEPLRFEDSLAEGTVTAELGQVTRKVEPCQVLLDVPLLLHLSIRTVVGQNYQGVASLHLSFVGQAYKPAILYFRSRRIGEDDILLAADTPQGWELTRRLGIQWRLVARLVRSKIREHIHARLIETRRARIMDLSTLALSTVVKQSMPGDPIPALARNDPALVISLRQVMRGVLEPQSTHFYALALGEGEQCKFRIYSTSDRYPVHLRGSLTVYSAAGEPIPGTRAVISTEAGWFGEYNIQEEIFKAPHVGIFRLGIRSDERRPDHLLRYVIVQERSRPDIDKPICFAPFGAELMKNVISPPVIEAKLKQLIPTTQAFGPLSVLPMVEAKGKARIALLAVEPEPPREQMADRELAYRVRLRVDPDVCITALGVQEEWRLHSLVALRLRVHAIASPLSIQIDPDELTVRAVKVLDATCIEGAGRFNQLNLLSRSIAQPLVDQIRQILRQTAPERTIRIEEFVAEALGERAPAVPPPRPLVSAKSLNVAVDGVAVSGQKPKYWKLHLERKQRVHLSAHWRLSALPGRPLNVSLAICDEHRGLLRSANVVSGATGRTDGARFSFTSPRAADYYVRLRVDPWKGDENIKADYELKWTTA